MKDICKLISKRQHSLTLLWTREIWGKKKEHWLKTILWPNRPDTAVDLHHWPVGRSEWWQHRAPCGRQVTHRGVLSSVLPGSVFPCWPGSYSSRDVCRLPFCADRGKFSLDMKYPENILWRLVPVRDILQMFVPTLITGCPVGTH